MDIGDFKKIKTQQDLRDYILEVEDALHQIIMNDGVYTGTELYCSLRFCRDALNYAKDACRDFREQPNSFNDK